MHVCMVLCHGFMWTIRVMTIRVMTIRVVNIRVITLGLHILLKFCIMFRVRVLILLASKTPCS